MSRVTDSCYLKLLPACRGLDSRLDGWGRRQRRRQPIRYHGRRAARIVARTARFIVHASTLRPCGGFSPRCLHLAATPGACSSSAAAAASMRLRLRLRAARACSMLRRRAGRKMPGREMAAATHVPWRGYHRIAAVGRAHGHRVRAGRPDSQRGGERGPPHATARRHDDKMRAPTEYTKICQRREKHVAARKLTL